MRGRAGWDVARRRLAGVLCACAGVVGVGWGGLLTWKLEMCSRSSGLVTDSWPEMGLMMKMPVGGWSAPGPVTLYRSRRSLSRSDRI